MRILVANKNVKILIIQGKMPLKWPKMDFVAMRKVCLKRLQNETLRGGQNRRQKINFAVCNKKMPISALMHRSFYYICTHK